MYALGHEEIIVAMAKPTVLYYHLGPREQILVKSEGICDRIMFHGNQINNFVHKASAISFKRQFR